MKYLFTALLFLSAALFAADKDSVAAKGLQTNPMDLLRAFEPAPNEPYTLGEGDEILVEANGRGEVTGAHVIGPDGSITLPLAGSVELRGLTREKAAEVINEKLARFYTNVTAVVRVTKYGSNKILLLGRVDHPGIHYFEGTPTLLEVLSRGGGMSKQPGSTESPVPARCAIFRGSDQVVWMNVRELLESGNRLADLRLRRNDVVFVPTVQDVIVSVLGEVRKPGVVALRQGMTLGSVLAEAGGLTDNASNKHIRLVNAATGNAREVTMDEVLDPKKSAEIALHSGDLIYVSKSGFAQMGLVFQRLSPVGSLLLFGSFVAH